MKAEKKRSEDFSGKKEFFKTIKVTLEKWIKNFSDFLKFFFGKLGKMQLTKPNSRFSEFKAVKIGEFSDFLDWFEGEKGFGGWNEWEYVKCIDSYLRLQVGKAGEIEGKDQVLFLRDYYGNIEVDRKSSEEIVLPRGEIVPRGEECIYIVFYDPVNGGTSVSFERSGEVMRYVGEDRAESDVESVSGDIKGKGLLEVLKSVRDRLTGLSERIEKEYEYEVEGDQGKVKVTEDVFVQTVGRVDRGKHVGEKRIGYLGGSKSEGAAILAARVMAGVFVEDKEYKKKLGNCFGFVADEKKGSMRVDSFVEEVRRGNDREDGNWVKIFKLYMDNKVNDCVGWIRVTARTVDRYWVEGDVILDWEDESYRFISKDRISIFEQIVKEDLFWYDWAEGISYTTDGPRDSNIFHFYYFGKYREEIYNKDGFKLIVSTNHGVELHVGESMSSFSVGMYSDDSEWRLNAMMVGFKELVKAIRNFEDKRDGVEDSARPKIEIDSPKDI